MRSSLWYPLWALPLITNAYLDPAYLDPYSGMTKCAFTVTTGASSKAKSCLTDWVNDLLNECTCQNREYLDVVDSGLRTTCKDDSTDRASASAFIKKYCSGIDLPRSSQDMSALSTNKWREYSANKNGDQTDGSNVSSAIPVISTATSDLWGLASVTSSRRQLFSTTASTGPTTIASVRISASATATAQATASRSDASLQLSVPFVLEVVKAAQQYMRLAMI